MSTIKVLVTMATVLLLIDLIIICRIIRNKSKYGKFEKITEKNKKVFLAAVLGNKHNRKKRTPPSNYFDMEQYIQLDKETRERIEKVININKIEKKYLRGQNSIFKTKRIESIVYLGLLKTEKARLALEKDLLKEKDFTIKIYIANALGDIGKKESIPVLIESLIGGEHFYRERVNMLIADFGKDFNDYLPQIIKIDKMEIMELIVDFSSVYFSQEAKGYIVNIIENKENTINKIRDEQGVNIYKKIKSEESFIKLVYKVFDILVEIYPIELKKDKYLFSKDLEISKRAINALSNLNPREQVDIIQKLLRNENTMIYAMNTISIIVDKNPYYIREVSNLFLIESDMKVKKEYGKILSKRMEYFIMGLLEDEETIDREIIKGILYLGIYNEIIDFLNKNKNKNIENEFVGIIKEVTISSTEENTELRLYLDKRILKKIGLAPLEEDKPIKIEKNEKELTIILSVLLVIILITMPIVFCIRREEFLYNTSFTELLKIYVVDFNYYFAFYSIAINSIYIILLIFSFINARRQAKLWRIKNMSLLFKKKVLPTVSVIIPAFNEAKTIIESANSLLNLKYPDYEVIIVNDGSLDNTLDVLINYFNLSKVTYSLSSKLNTRPLRGIYMNPSLPKIIVVDKYNGGKADALNTGINVSSKRYFCGIDADCLLDPDSLLKLTSLTLDTGVETPAIGGSVYPINGCEVRKGQIKIKKIPEGKLAKLQSIEYIRSFMGGRIGWAYIKSLLIISGAYGLFRKERVVQVGGYLTSNGRYGKATLGEDMELIVRLSRYMKENGNKHKICYSFNANCWTEVPEDLKSLKKQRHRWHKGLIEVLVYHRKMIFNPRYGRIGMISMPYFLIFEMSGPIIEFIGYLMVILSAILGILNIEIVLILFIATVLMGVFISLSSLLLVERDIKYYTRKEILILIWYSFIENFGPRQLFSFWRVSGFFRMYMKPSGWNKLERKGF